MVCEESWDAIIAGCGPTGAVAGREVAKKGFRVLILEEHREVGRPVQCAGLVTRRALAEVPAEDCVLNSLSAAELVTPSGRRVRFGGGGERAVVVDRAGYDRRAAEMAIDSGCRISLGAKVVGLAAPRAARGRRAGYVERSGFPVRVTVRVDGCRRELGARVLIGADGVGSFVRRALGLAPPPEILPGFEAELTGVECPRDTVTVLVGREVAPGFFAWLIPSGGRRGILGLCCEPGPAPARAYFDRLMRNRSLAPFIGKASVLGYMAGSVPLGPAPRTVSGRAALVGDAAGQVKPVTGGGLYTGTLCARLAGEAVAGALEGGDVEMGLRVYERVWRTRIGSELRVGRLIRRAFVNVTDGQMEELAELLDRPELIALVSAHGDLDAPSKLAKLLFRQAPGLLKFAGPLVKSLFK